MKLLSAFLGITRRVPDRKDRNVAANKRAIASLSLHLLRPALPAGPAITVVAALAFLAPRPVVAETLCVQTDYNTIQEAIDAAANGDIILVEPDFYYENIDFAGKEITLRSTDGPEATTLDGSQLTRGPDFGSVVTFTTGEGPDAVLEGFTVTGGNGTFFTDDDKDFRAGGGVLCIKANPTIAGNIITGNTASGIYLSDSSPVLTWNVIAGNSGGVGGGVRFGGTGALTLTSCTLESNLASYAGGGVATDPLGAVLRLEACTIRDNEAGIIGGGVVCWGPLEAVDCRFEGNDAGFGAGGVLLADTGSFERCWFSDNGALVGGAVAMGEGLALDLHRCVFLANEAIDAGGLLYVDASGSGQPLVEFRSCTLISNSSPSGSAVYIEEPTPGNPLGWEPLVSFLDSIIWNSGDGLFEENAGTVEASYSLIEGGHDGDGNLDEDPLFVDAENGDFRLTKDSPCVDAGDPKSPLDPDGTTADMGAFPFIQFGFFRGDANGNGETFALLDALAILDWQFGTGEEPPCMDAADADDNGSVSAILEALYLLQWQFIEGPAPPDPGPDFCGLDATDDTVDCATSTECP